ncbi:MAG: hypothetical protein HY606_12635 [Planctomycetes bacterium]|nr:hypothetical protein [Planctomycetota bacterium]
MWWWIGSFFFGSIGFVAFVYGKRNLKIRPMIVGILLMIYSYFTDSTVLVFTIGVSLTAVLYIFRE